MKKFVHFILAGIFVLPYFGEEIKADSSTQKRSGVIALPVLFYTPETKLAGGAVMNYYFREPGSTDASRPSTLMPSIIYTRQRQIISELVADLYWQDEAYHIMGYIGYKKFPDKFYGIGNNTPESNEENYTPRSAIIRVNIQKSIGAAWNAGVFYEYEYNKIVKIEPGGLLGKGDILGSAGGTTSGLGVLVNRDARDNIFFPTSGSYCQLTVNRFDSHLGSDFTFTSTSLNVRRYLRLRPAHVLALHAYSKNITGEPPFRKMSMIGDRIGGSNLMRGYYEGRYRDKNMLAFQAEYRIMPLWWRFGLVAFAGFGDVSDKMKNFELRKFKYSVGGGIRFLINQKEKLNIRLDFAYGKNSSGMYITIGEAF